MHAFEGDILRCIELSNSGTGIEGVQNSLYSLLG